MPSLDHLSEEDFCIILGKTETEANKYKPKPPTPPKRSICASSVPKIYFPVSQAMQVKIVDFGGAFRGPDDAPETVHVPRYLEPPESIFGERLDHRFDMWSMGCLVSEASNPDQAEADLLQKALRARHCAAALQHLGRRDADELHAGCTAPRAPGNANALAATVARIGKR